MQGPNWKDVYKEIKKLNIPKEYYGLDLESIGAYQWNIYLSIRETAGKTTSSIITGLVLNKLYPDHYTIEYIRNDASQITRGNVEDLFNTVISFDYISKIYNGRWNSVRYHSQAKKFYLVKLDSEGSVLEESDEPILILHSLEKYADYKSVYNNVKGNYIVFDEFMDTTRATYGLFTELLNVVSTIGRPMSPGRTEWLRILLLGNNTNQYSFWFDEFGISDDINNLKFGGSITFNTEYGTTGICKLLEVGETQKKRLTDKRIPFLGFPGKKAAAFTGATEWSGKTYKHISWDLNYDNCIFRRAYVNHRSRFIQLDIFKEEKRGIYVFAHFSNAPLKEDNIIFTLDPLLNNDVYGFGKYEKRKKINSITSIYTDLLRENRFYYSSNMAGALIDDFIKNIR